MSKRTLLLLSLFITLSSTAQQNAIKPQFSIVFDTAHGKELLRQCSRSTPQNVSNFWTPIQSDIDSLESNLEKIYKLTGLKCCILTRDSLTLKDFSFQYLGIMINRKKFIYINAFPLNTVEQYKNIYKKDLGTNAVIVCDGGRWYWGVVYNLQTRTFLLLKFNGYA